MESSSVPSRRCAVGALTPTTSTHGTGPVSSGAKGETVEAHPIEIIIHPGSFTKGEADATEATPVETQATAEQQKTQTTESCCVCFQWPVRETGWCGLPVEERPDFSTIWDRAEAYSLAIPAFFLFLVLLFTTIYSAADEETQSTLSWMRPPDMDTFLTLLTTFAATALLLVLGMSPIGLLTWYGGVSVAITRKISHIIFITLLPLTVVYLNEQEEGLARDMYLAMVWQSLSSTLLLAILFSKASRKYVPLLRIAFAGIERSDDRPHALTWFSLQMVGQTLVQIPMIQWMLQDERGLLIWIPFLSVGLGDGLAEPVGRIWGKHKYKVRALCSSKRYTRSFEGSAVVFFWTAVAVAIGTPDMTSLQAVFCFLTIPLANTIMEAISPHTFDNHFMWAVTWLLLWIIFDVIP